MESGTNWVSSTIFDMTRFDQQRVVYWRKKVCQPQYIGAKSKHMFTFGVESMCSPVIWWWQQQNDAIFGGSAYNLTPKWICLVLIPMTYLSPLKNLWGLDFNHCSMSLHAWKMSSKCDSCANNAAHEPVRIHFKEHMFRPILHLILRYCIHCSFPTEIVMKDQRQK